MKDKVSGNSDQVLTMDETKSPPKDQDNPNAFEKANSLVKEGSLVSVSFGGRSLQDDFCIWLVFTLTICILILVKFIMECTTIGMIQSSSEYK